MEGVMFNEKNKLSSLTTLKITAGGYEELGYEVPVVTVDEYMKNKVPFYAEFILLPDGRIVDAQPSHAYCLDSLLNYLNGGKFHLSPTWFIEERLYYTGAVACWIHGQSGFAELTKEQKETLEKLSQNDVIKFNYHSYDEDKIDYFLSIKDDVRKKVIEFANKHE